VDWLVLLVLVLVVFGALSLVVDTFRAGISPMPSSRRQVEGLLAAIPPDFSGVVFELGAGWGSVAFALARRFPRARVVAFELAMLPFAFLWLRQHVQRRGNLELRHQSFFAADLGGADLFTAYLYPGAMQRLSSELPSRAKPGALLITHTFAARGLLRVDERRLQDRWRTPVEVYRCERDDALSGERKA
jgi:hypothetical protein